MDYALRITMLRFRTILFLVSLVVVVYWLSPAERKQRIRGKLRQIWLALTLALAIYWIWMLATLVMRNP